MNIYLLKQDLITGKDTYNSAIVIADTIEEAKSIHPANYTDKNYWCEYTWPSRDQLDHIKVIQLGIAYAHLKKGVVLSSLNID